MKEKENETDRRGNKSWF